MTNPIKIPFSLKSDNPTSITITHVSYTFLSLLPVLEPLSSRGPRLHQTPAQRQTPTYGPDVFIKLAVAEASHKLIANFVDDRRMVLVQGERKEMKLWLSNMGRKSVREVWLVGGKEDVIWVGKSGQEVGGLSFHFVLEVRFG